MDKGDWEFVAWMSAYLTANAALLFFLVFVPGVISLPWWTYGTGFVVAFFALIPVYTRVVFARFIRRTASAPPSV